MALIRIDGLSKCYAVARGGGSRLWHALRGEDPDPQGFWALRDVSLAIERGETVGILGRNGAGKSTLLQVVAGTQKPTRGAVRVHGRLAAILELGAGFDPAFTGRENARLNATLLGIPAASTEATMAAIEDFAEIGEFFDRPVRTYSSGMYARLAFAVASAVDPDVLIVDEALAVGDVRFQTKCFRRIDALKARGTTILFVSHALDLVTRHCTRVVLLDGGRLVADGPPREIANRYMDLMFGPGRDADAALSRDAAPGLLPSPPGTGDLEDRLARHPAYNPHEYRYGEGGVRIVEGSLRTAAGDATSTFRATDEVEVSFRVALDRDVDALILGLTVRTPDGMPVAGTNSRVWTEGAAACSGRAGEVVVATFRFTPAFASGNYFLSLGAAEARGEDIVALDRRYDVLHFVVEGSGRSTGLVDLGMRFAFARAA